MSDMTEQEAIRKFREVGKRIIRCSNSLGKTMLEADHDYRQLPKLRKQHRELHKLLHITYGYSFQQLDITVPFPCESEIGTDMFDMNVLH